MNSSTLARGASFSGGPCQQGLWFLHLGAEYVPLMTGMCGRRRRRASRSRQAGGRTAFVFCFLSLLAELPLGAPLRGGAVLARGVRRRRGGRLGARPRAGGLPRASSAAGPNGPFRGALELVGRRAATASASAASPTRTRSSGQANYEAMPAHRGVRVPLPLLRARPGQARPRDLRGGGGAAAGRRRSRCLFLDDNAANVAAAEATGFAARHVRGVDDARLALTSAGVLAT